VVDPSQPLACYCPATTSYNTPSATSCSPTVQLCSGSYICDPSCLTCSGPSNLQCFSCVNSSQVLFQSGSNAYGQCVAPCTSTQYRNSNGNCQNLDCSPFNYCNGNGACVENTTSQVSVCACLSPFTGSNCSIPLSCPTLNNCGGNGTCSFNTVTDSLYCQCHPGWIGNNCSTAVAYATSALVATEVGGTQITITSSANFTVWDNVACTLGGHSVTGFIVPPLAYCNLPPYFTYLVLAPFTVLVNGTTKITSRMDMLNSNLIPYSTAMMNSLMWTTGTARTISYKTTNVFSLGSSTVSVRLYQWIFDPYNINAPTPVLMDLGVIATGPNNGTISVTISEPFNWTTTLYVLSLQSGIYASNQYAALNSSTAAAQCTYFAENGINIENSGWPFAACPSPGYTSTVFDACAAVIMEPLMQSSQTCTADPDTDDICLYPSATPNTWEQLWEPYKPSNFQGTVVQYFASVTLPKLFCCEPTSTKNSNIPSTCQNNYIANRVLQTFSLTKRSSGGPTTPRYALGLAYGTTHFLTLDGSHFTFNALGEFVLLQNTTTNLSVQIRLVREGGANATYVSAAAIEYESSSLGVYLDQYGQFAITFSGEFRTTPLSVGDQILLPGESITLTMQSANTLKAYLFNGIIVTIQSDQVSSLTSLQFLVPYAFVGTPSSPSFSGLLGQFDGARSDDFLLQGGSLPLSSSSTTQQLQSFGDSWRVGENETLFLYPTGQDYTTMNDNTGFVPDYPETLAVNPQFTVTAQKLCQAAGSAQFQSDCVFDVVEAGSYKASAASISMGRLYSNSLLGSNQPPAISPNSASILQVHLNDNIAVSFGVSDVDGNEFGVFPTSSPSTGGILASPPNNSSNAYTFSFTVTGDLFLAPSIAPLVIIAVDTNGLASSATTNFQVVYST